MVVHAYATEGYYLNTKIMPALQFHVSQTSEMAFLYIIYLGLCLDVK